MKRIVILFFALLLVLPLLGCESTDYKNAVSVMNAGDYEAAAQAFDQLGAYKDAVDQANECRYEIALAQMKQTEYLTAGKLFDALGDYGDARDKAATCKYRSAASQMKSGAYAAAYDTFMEIADHKDAVKMAAACKVELAKAAIENEAWDEAITHLDGLDHEEGAQLLKQAKREKGMRENADYAFLAAIDKSVRNRAAQADEGTAELEAIVDAELAMLEEYEDAAFYDDTIKDLARKYIRSVRTQKAALYESSTHKINIAWQSGMAERAEVVKTLYETYGMFADNPLILDNLVFAYDNLREIVNALYAIEEDLVTQINAWTDEAVVYKNNELSFTLSNNTKYAYTAVFEWLIYESDDETLVEKRETVVEDIRPGERFAVAARLSPRELEHFSWSRCYYDIES